MADRDEFRLKIRLYNNLLVSRREEFGMTQAEFSRAVGVSPTVISAMEVLKFNPLTFDEADWKEQARRVADFHGVSPEELWPEAILRVENPTAQRNLAGHEMERLSGNVMAMLPEDTIADEDMRKAVHEAVDGLTGRERRVIDLRFGLSGGETYTLDEAGTKLGVGKEQIRQIEARALRKLRHPSRTRKIVAAVGAESLRWAPPEPEPNPPPPELVAPRPFGPPAEPGAPVWFVPFAALRQQG